MIALMLLEVQTVVEVILAVVIIAGAAFDIVIGCIILSKQESIDQATPTARSLLYHNSEAYVASILKTHPNTNEVQQA